jgi:hypothetical protein
LVLVMGLLEVIVKSFVIVPYFYLTYCR